METLSDYSYYQLGDRKFRLNEELVGSDEEYDVSEIINKFDVGIINSNQTIGYGILKSSALFDYDIGFIGYLDSKVNSSIGRTRIPKENDPYEYVIYGVIGLNDFDIIASRYLKIIQDFYCVNKKIYMVKNYGIIYSGNKNTYTPSHTKSCDIIINICLHNNLTTQNCSGALCYYTSQPSVFSKHQKNIRISFQMQTGDLIIHKGNQPTEVFSIGKNRGYRTHLIIECNFIQ